MDPYTGIFMLVAILCSFVFFVVVAIAIVFAIFKLSSISRKKEAERTTQLKQLASLHGFANLEISRDQVHATLQKFLVPPTGRRHSISNYLNGEYHGYTATFFDHYFVTGSRDHTAHYRQTIVVMESSKAHLPRFSLTPEGLFTKIGHLLSQNDIDFPNHPEFSKSYALKGENPEAIRRLFTPSILNYFADNQRLHVEGGGRMLTVYRLDHRPDAEEVIQFLDERVKIFQMFAM